VTRIKFCGITNEAEIEAAVACGADALGFILAASPRQIGVERFAALVRRVPPFVTPVAVLVDPASEEVGAVTGIDRRVIVQYSGNESAAFCEAHAARLGMAAYVKVFHRPPSGGSPPDAAAIEAYARALALFDTSDPARAGGTGKPFDWQSLRGLGGRRFGVAGGLTPENAGACVRAVRPFLVDARSGIERAERKDAGLMRAFVRAVREADAAAG
jgi:phosphoribosylanthranilate isomerase